MYPSRGCRHKFDESFLGNKGGRKLNVYYFIKISSKIFHNISSCGGGGVEVYSLRFLSVCLLHYCLHILSIRSLVSSSRLSLLYLSQAIIIHAISVCTV